MLKIVALSWLCAAATGKVHPSPTTLGKIYWFTELLGRWSMVDIFVVGILVSIVQLGNYMTITPGPGALAFAGRGHAYDVRGDELRAPHAVGPAG